MSNKSFIEKSKIDKKLCIHCKHCNIYVDNKIMCGLYRNKVDDKELYSAWENRYSKRCDGVKWEIRPEIVVCESEKESDFLHSEYSIQEFLPLARKIVRGEATSGYFTCGRLVEAIKRAEQEFEDNLKR